MHAQQIIQDLLVTECPFIHAKRRVVSGATSIRHRIKRCDRLLGNSKLEKERHLIYGAMARRVISGKW